LHWLNQFRHTRARTFFYIIWIHQYVQVDKKKIRAELSSITERQKKISHSTKIRETRGSLHHDTHIITTTMLLFLLYLK